MAPTNSALMIGRGGAGSRQLRAPTPRIRLFIGFNVAVLILTAAGQAGQSNAGAGLVVYLMALTAICTLPLLMFPDLRGRGCLLTIYLAYAFTTYGLNDIAGLFFGGETEQSARDSLLSGGETAILAGLASFLVGYVLVARAIPQRSRGILRSEWSKSFMVLLALVAWSTGFLITAIFQLDLERLSSNPFTGVLSMMRNLQPLGSLILIYQFLARDSRPALAWLIVTMAGDVALGLIGDSKEVAFRAPFLLVLAYMTLRGRIPVLQTLVLVALAGLAFSFFASYREVIQTSYEGRDRAITESIGENLQDTFSGSSSLRERLADGLDYLATRSTLKGNVELVVAETGKTVAFQNGYTLSILYYVFLPRYFFPEKPGSSTGQLFNQEFKVSWAPETYISVGNIGEFYWNFGWPGVAIGMLVLGAVLAALNALVDLRQATLPRFLLLMITAYLLCIRSEANIGLAYTFWLRTALLLLVIDRILPRSRPMRSPASTDASPAATPVRA